MTDPTEDPVDRMDALFANQPTGQRIRTVARGISRLGGKPFTITVEQELPENAEAQEDGVLQQMELGFHAMFGARAQHLGPDGEETHDLRKAIEVEITGDPNYAAASDTRDRLTELAREEGERARQAAIARLVETALRPDDSPGSLN